MRCIKCGKVNINKANFCKNCKYEFSKKEQEAAKRQTIPGKLEVLESIYNLKGLNFIFGSNLFKIIFCIFMVLVNIYVYYSSANHLKLLNSEEYVVEHKDGEYYVKVNEDNVNLLLFIPNKIDDLRVKHMNLDNKVIDEFKYEKGSKLLLSVNENNDYYLLDGNTESLKVFVYKAGEE